MDQRFQDLRPFSGTVRPAKGWLRAIRDALGMTSSQFARRLGVSQPRISELERYEINGGISLNTLQRAAEVLGCRVVYALVPNKPLEQTVRERAAAVANRRLEAVEQTMRLEDQAVPSRKTRRDALDRLVEELMRKPSRLWDDDA